MMGKKMVVAVGVSAIVIIATTVHLTIACNEAVCASLVSKCMLLKSCECDMRTNCTCCKDCYQCLHDLYTECCSCVGMCPEQSEDVTKLSEKSSIEDLKEPIPDLFKVLTEEQDHLKRWITYTYPAHQHIKFFEPSTDDSSFEFSVAGKDGKMKTLEIDQELAINCTVSYMSQCMSLHKCKVSCSSMGASKYRWFHDGCCECVGHTCYNYGMNESKCWLCSEDADEEEEEDVREEEEEMNKEFVYTKKHEKKESTPQKKDTALPKESATTSTR